MNESHFNGRKSKLLKVGNRDNEDRISSLPNAIICNILSFLPTKYTVATSVLSSRWKHLWTLLPNLCFDDRLCLEYTRTGTLTDDALTRFEDFVDSVLPCDSGNISKFSLRCSKISYLFRLKFWVSFAIMRNACEIELDVENDKPIELPNIIYTSKALNVVKLDLNLIMRRTPSGICFPSAKILHVTFLNFDNNLTEWLFSNCPALEDLKIIGFLFGSDLVTFNISSPPLKSLSLEFEDCNSQVMYTGHQVVIRAPNLEHLYVTDYQSACYMVHELHSLTLVFVDFDSGCMEDYDPPSVPVTQLLEGISNAKILSLSKRTMHDSGFTEYACGRTEPLCVPHCLLSSLKRIEMREFTGHKGVLKLIQYLLKNGEVLNEVIIRFHKICSQLMGLKEKLYQELLMYERGSKSCQVNIR